MAPASPPLHSIKRAVTSWELTSDKARLFYARRNMTAVVVGLRLSLQQAASGCREGRRDCRVSCAFLCFSGV